MFILFSGRSLLWVATHELGHALGLAHSNDKESVMYTDYRGYDLFDVHLNHDDVKGIQSIYG